MHTVAVPQSEETHVYSSELHPPFTSFCTIYNSRVLFSYWLLLPSLQPTGSFQALQGFPGAALPAACSAEMPYPAVRLKG